MSDSELIADLRRFAAELKADVAARDAELMEQCRLLGMSSEREAKHLARIAELEATLADDQRPRIWCTWHDCDQEALYCVGHAQELMEPQITRLTEDLRGASLMRDQAIEQIAQLTARVKELEELQEQLSMLESAWHTDVARQNRYRAALERIDNPMMTEERCKAIAREALAP